MTRSLSSRRRRALNRLLRRNDATPPITIDLKASESRVGAFARAMEAEFAPVMLKQLYGPRPLFFPYDEDYRPGWRSAVAWLEQRASDAARQGAEEAMAAREWPWPAR